MATSIVHQSQGRSGQLLCLKCRGVGHKVEKCPNGSPHDEYGWFFSAERREMDFENASSILPQELCHRCQNLDLLGFLRQEIPWKSREDLESPVFNWSKFVKILGQSGSTEFWNNCSLCRCLFALTPTPITTAQYILMLPNWSLNRLEGGIFLDTPEKRRSSRCLLVALHPSSYDLPFSDRAQRGDALCVLEDESRDDHTTSLGGRLIDSHNLCTEIIECWLSCCDVRHPVSCKPVHDPRLNDIRLVDVSSRQIVQYPGKDCEYVALSYVWGNVDQQSFQPGVRLPELPQTIEDAILLTEKLKKQYLWVDFVCIDQKNEVDKNHQIDRMSTIYRGACFTVVALSGLSARAGLPRLGTKKPVQPQMNCFIDGTRLVGLMPTLSQQLWSSPWGTRAWTLQEGLLSPRCLYISDHQVYFECNAMQCSESVNESRSWVHKLYRNTRPTEQTWSEAEVGGGVLRNPLVGLSGLKNNRLVQYGSGLCLYSYRSMSNPVDALKAFSAILQYLEKDYSEGFFCGLPIADFQWGLLWRSQSPPRRRKGFPSWSWAGWEGALWPGFPQDLYKPHEFQPYLQIWKAVDNQLVQLFKATQRPCGDANVFASPFQNDPITTSTFIDLHDLDFHVNIDIQAEEKGYIFVEGVILYLIPDYSKPLLKVRQRGKLEHFEISLRGVTCRLEIMSTDNEIGNSTRQTEMELLVLARDLRDDWMSHHLLLLDREGGTAQRRTTLSLWVPKDRLAVLEELRPQKTRVVLL